MSKLHEDNSIFIWIDSLDSSIAVEGITKKITDMSKDLPSTLCVFVDKASRTQKFQRFFFNHSRARGVPEADANALHEYIKLLAIQVT